MFGKSIIKNMSGRHTKLLSIQAHNFRFVVRRIYRSARVNNIFSIAMFVQNIAPYYPAFHSAIPGIMVKRYPRNNNGIKLLLLFHYFLKKSSGPFFERNTTQLE